MGVLANPPRGTQLLYPKAHGSLDVAWRVFLSSPLPKSLGLSFLHSRPGEAGAAGRAPTFTGVDEGAQRRRGGRGGRLARSAAGFRRPGTRRRHCAPAALLPGGVAARSQPFHLPVSFRHLCLPALLRSRVSQPPCLWPSVRHESRVSGRLCLSPPSILFLGLSPGFFCVSNRAAASAFSFRLLDYLRFTRATPGVCPGRGFSD